MKRLTTIILLVMLMLFSFLLNSSAQQQSTTVQCPSGQKPQVVTTSQTAARITCVASTATPTPTPKPTPTPTPIPVPVPTPIGTVAELPRIFLNTTMPSTGASKSYNVEAGDDLQAAFNQVQGGEQVVIREKASFIGHFIIPAKINNGKWIIIVTSGSLPAPGNRVGPVDAAGMPKLITPDTMPPLVFADGSNMVRVIGVEITFAATAVPDPDPIKGGPYVSRLVELGSLDTTDVAKHPTHITIDRSYIHGLPTKNLRRCVMLNSRYTAIIDSHLSDAHEVGADSQAIFGGNGPGPYKIVNNYLEGAGENIMFGGADPKIKDLIPSDGEIRRNHIFKPLSWKGGQWVIKTSIEIKNGQRFLIDGNVIENSWAAAQDGYAILLKSVNQDQTAPWSHTGDVTVTNNVFKNVAGGLNLLGTDDAQRGVKMTRVLVHNNALEITGDYALVVSEVADLTITQNSFVNRSPANASILKTYGAASQRFIATGNVISQGPYGIKGDGLGSGVPTLTVHFPNAVFVRNVILNADPAIYPPGNFFAATLGAGYDKDALDAAQIRP